MRPHPFPPKPPDTVPSMVALSSSSSSSSSSRKESNSAIRARVFSISAFDSPWYLDANGLSNVSLNKAWSHYRSLGQAQGLQARYDVTELALNLISEEFNTSFTKNFHSLLKKRFFKSVYFYPENLPKKKGTKLSKIDPFYQFADIFRRELRHQNSYGAALNLRALLATPETATPSSNQALFQLLESILYPDYALIATRIERFEKRKPANFTDLTPEEINGVERCFDKDYYCGVYADIWMAGVNPLGHFLNQGRLEGRHGSLIFDPVYYLSVNQDVEASGVDPFVHYIMHGWRERRNPSEAFPHQWLNHVFPEANKDINGFCGHLVQGVSGEQKLQILHTNFNNRKNPDFRPKPKSIIAHHQDVARIFAFYLTQYHPIKQNDDAWGKGFTEWRNVTKAFPRYFGHYQPKLPADSTLYDLRLRETIIDHVELAKAAGVSGFCFYFYWFSGERILETPLDLFLNAVEEADFPFCILWANENWTRKWDGKAKDVIIGQKYNDSDALQFIQDVEPILLDSRYERTNGRPILIVYRPDDLPDCGQWVKIWRDYWRDQGYGELHLVCVQFLPDTDARNYGFDAILQFPPNGFPNHGTHQKIASYTRSFSGSLYSYDEMQWRAMAQQYDYPVYRTSVPSWDNESRRPLQGDTFVGSTPEKFRDWTASNLLNARHDNDAGLSFINAWNEWAESACLEPDSRYGYAHLEAVADARAIANVLREVETWTTSHSSAIIIHAFYLDSIESISRRLKLYQDCCDIYFTMPPLGCHEKIDVIRQSFPCARFFISPNRGRDVLPFLSLCKTLKARNIQYDKLCKLHTKKSLHRIDGSQWLEELVDSLLPIEGAQKINSLFVNGVGMLIPKGHALALTEFMGGNESLLNIILDLNGAMARKTSSSYFASGTMFWLRGDVLARLNDDERAFDFEYERGQVDGTLAHAWERAIAILVQASGWRCLHSDGSEVVVAPPGVYKFANLEGRVDLMRGNDLRTATVIRSLERQSQTAQKRVAIVATYPNNQDEVANVKHICAYLRRHGYFVACINPGFDYNAIVSDEELLNHLSCDLYLERSNSGYDFGSWAEGFFFLKGRGELHADITDELLIVNDSCLLADLNSDLIERARGMQADIVGLTDSHQFLHHIQSNFMLVRRFQHCDALLDSFFAEYQKRSLQSKDDVIQFGELALAHKLDEMQIQWKAIFEMKELIALTLQKYADSPSGTWESQTLAKLAEGQLLNPHHYMHEVLYLHLGCPLIKKELLRDNPANYPGVMRYRSLIPQC